MRFESDLDGIHDILGAGCVDLQAEVEGILDGPLARVVNLVGPVEEAGVGMTMLVTNHVGRFLRDAYGPVPYAHGLGIAQADMLGEARDWGRASAEADRERADMLADGKAEGMLADAALHFRRQGFGAGIGVGLALSGTIAGVSALLGFLRFA